MDTTLTAPSSPRLQIHTRERRYLLEDPSIVEALLRARHNPIEYVPGQEESRIMTVYFDTARGTWSQGRGSTKIRCKNYADPSNWWFELKRRVGIVVDKWRRPVSTGDLTSVLNGSQRGDALARFIGNEPLLPIAIVTYRRVAFEANGLRVTIDRDVRFHQPNDLAPGRLLGELDRSIVEVKRDGTIPEWLVAPLKGWRARSFSKSKSALVFRNRAGSPAP